MHVQRLAEGLWRWTAPHPAWRGGADWPREVGCVYYEPAAGPIVLIDPQLPEPYSPDASRFWRALDGDVERLGRPVAVLTGNPFHVRSAAAFRQRYDARHWIHAAAPAALREAATDTFLPGDPLPGDVVALPVEGLEPSEVVFRLTAHRALVFADAVIGAGAGRVRLAPTSWAPEGGAAHHAARLGPSLRALLDPPPEWLLPSHGEPVLRDAATALAMAIDAVQGTPR